MGTVARLLSIELVPESTWYRNVRSSVSRDVWREIQHRFRKGQCQICGYGRLLSKPRLNCHEVWRYDDKTRVQKLLGFMYLCTLCHGVKHLGLAGIMAQRGDLDYQELVKHYCSVNGCTVDDFVEDRKQAFELWKVRSVFDWTVDMSFLEKLGLTGLGGRVREYIRAHPNEIDLIKQRAGL